MPGPPSIGDVGSNPIGGGSFFDPDYVPHIIYPRIDPDPGMSPHMPFGPGSGSGSNGAMMMSAGYNDPNFGLPSDSGGSFIGTGRCYAPCNIPPDIQPAIPPDGLFGPDMPLPGWFFPGYKRPPDITHPQMPQIMPAYRPVEGPSTMICRRPIEDLPDIGFGDSDPVVIPRSYPELHIIETGYATHSSFMDRMPQMLGASEGSGGSGDGGGIIPGLINAALTVAKTIVKAIGKKSRGSGISTGEGKYDSSAVSNEGGKEIPWDDSLTESVNYNKGNYTDETWRILKDKLGDEGFREFVNEVIPWFEETYDQILQDDKDTGTYKEGFPINWSHIAGYFTGTQSKGGVQCGNWSTALSDHWKISTNSGPIKRNPGSNDFLPNWEGREGKKPGHAFFYVYRKGKEDVRIPLDPQGANSSWYRIRFSKRIWNRFTSLLK